MKNRQSRGKGPDSSIMQCFDSKLICNNSGYQHKSLSKCGILPSFCSKISPNKLKKSSLEIVMIGGKGSLISSLFDKYLAKAFIEGISSVV